MTTDIAVNELPSGVDSAWFNKGSGWYRTIRITWVDTNGLHHNAKIDPDGKHSGEKIPMKILSAVKKRMARGRY